MVRCTTMTTLDLTLNGTPMRIAVRDGETLLETLRTRCGVTSIKDGCQPQGQCGCCLVLIDGNAKVSCAMPAEAARWKSIVTLGNGQRANGLFGNDRLSARSRRVLSLRRKTHAERVL